MKIPFETPITNEEEAKAYLTALFEADCDYDLYERAEDQRRGSTRKYLFPIHKANLANIRAEEVFKHLGLDPNRYMVNLRYPRNTA